MNRDREAVQRDLDRALYARLDGWASEMDRSAKAMREAGLPHVAEGNERLAADLRLATTRLALPVGGGVELQDTIRGLRVRWGHAIASGKSHLPLYLDELELILAALSPRSLLCGEISSGSAQDALPGARSHPSEDQAPSALAVAARKLLDACLLADAHEELSEHVDGSLLDALREALDA